MAKIVLLHDCEDCIHYEICSEVKNLPTDCEDFEWNE